jgi:hypothetical protein
MGWRRGKIPWLVPLVAALGAVACGGNTDVLWDAGATTGDTTTSSGTGGSAGTTTSSGTGGSGGATSSGAAGHDATAFVSAGLVAENGQHRMVFTVGQVAGGLGTMKNASHRLEGGLVGAAEKTP